MNHRFALKSHDYAHRNTTTDWKASQLFIEASFSAKKHNSDNLVIPKIIRRNTSLQMIFDILLLLFNTCGGLWYFSNFVCYRYTTQFKIWVITKLIWINVQSYSVCLRIIILSSYTTCVLHCDFLIWTSLCKSIKLQSKKIYNN